MSRQEALREGLREAGRRSVREARDAGEIGGPGWKGRLTRRASGLLGRVLGVEWKDLVVLGVLASTVGPALEAGVQRAERLELDARAADHAVVMEEAVAGANVAVMDERLADAIAELADRSPSFARWWETVRASEATVYVGTYEQLDGVATAAGVVHYTDAASGYEAGFAEVAIHVGMFEDYGRFLKRRYPGQDEAIDEAMHAEMLVTVAHEIGHLEGFAAGGGRLDAPRCDDPHDDSERETACIVERENRVRAELGLPRDPDYGVDDPSHLLRRWLTHYGHRLPAAMRLADRFDAAPDADEPVHDPAVTATAAAEHGRTAGR